ncbi:MAG: hypothetical protein JO152_15150, partial [Mycobacteriaceae bacterium]|nr:hypothetical protein [Mycobacteriaceae bacterium]
MSGPDLNLSLDPTNAIVSSLENEQSLDYIDSGALVLVSGLDPFQGPAYTQIPNPSNTDNIIASVGGGIAPQTLTTAEYTNLHLVQGEKLTINTYFSPGDFFGNDEAFTLLQDSHGHLTPALLATTQSVYNTASFHYSVTYTINATDTYTLLAAVGDIGDVSAPSSLRIESITTDVPSGQYQVSGAGVQLADGSLLHSDGSLTSGGATNSQYLSSSGAGAVAGLQQAYVQGLISQDGAGLVAQGAGNVISNDGGSLTVLANNASLISQDGGGVVSHDGGSVVSHDGGSVVSHDGGSVVSHDGGSFYSLQSVNASSQNARESSAHDSAASAGLAGPQNKGLLSVNGGPANRPPPTAQAPTPTPLLPVPGVEVQVSPPASTSRGADSQPAMTDLGNGQYAVAFIEPHPPSFQPSSRVQVVNADGSLFGPEQRLNNLLQTAPAIASLGAGSYVVATVVDQSYYYQGALVAKQDVQESMFNASGNETGYTGNFLDDFYAGGQRGAVQLASLDAGGFAGIWTARADNQTATQNSLQYRSFNARATPTSSLVTIAPTGTLSGLDNPTIAPVAGGLAFAYQATDTSSGSAVHQIVFNSTANQGPPVVIDGNVSQLQADPVMTRLSNGNLAIAWISVDPSGQSSVFAQVVSPTGSAVGAQAYVTGTDDATMGKPSITALSDGGFAVGWTDNSGSADQAMAQLFTGNGTLSGNPFNAYAPGGGVADVMPSLATLPNGTLVAATAHQFADGSADIRALPFSIPQTGSATGALQGGSAYHGYIAGATVFADANGNGRLDAGEASATTTAGGRWTLPPHSQGMLVLTGGTDTVTGQPFTQTYTAPAGSTAIDALTTLVQKVMAAGSDIGTAQAKVATALGLPADTAISVLDPVLSAQDGSPTGVAALTANATVADVVALARAAGARDPLSSFAAQIAANPAFVAFDPSSTTALAASGLSGQVLTDTAAIAASLKALLAAKASADSGSQIVTDVDRAQLVIDNGAAPALAAALATGNTASVAAAYTGANLDAQFNGTSLTPGTIGVYRFFDSHYGTHFFTASATERDTILATRPDLVSEGVGLSAVDPASNDPNGAPVYRFFDTTYGTHFFT